MNQRIALQVDEAFYIKDPMSSDLGESIVEHGILMLDELGYETFTFRKLAERIGTTVMPSETMAVKPNPATR